MLGKLFKNEFKATWKLMVCVFGVILVLAELVALFDRTGFMESSLANNPFMSVATKFITTMFVLALMFLALFCFIVCSMRFYKTMYSEQGYLTHTLPVNPLSTFFVKVVVSTVWVFASVIMFALSLLIQAAASNDTNVFHIIIELCKHLFNREELAILNEKIMTASGCGIWGLIGLLVLLVLVLVIYAILWIYTSMTVGQLSTNHKAGMSVLTGICLYLAGQIGSIYLLVKIFGKMGVSLASSGEDVLAAFTGADFFWVLIGVFAGICLIEAAIDCIIIKKKINLQ